MTRFDVFEVLEDGQPLWRASASQIEVARAIAEAQAADTKKHYFVFDQTMQIKITVGALTGPVAVGTRLSS